MSSTRQDDCARLLRILADAPAEGLSQEEIQAATKSGETWSLRTINDVLCDIRGQVSNTKVRGRSGRSTVKYAIKGS